MSLDHFIITVFCLVDDVLTEVLKATGQLRQRGSPAQLDDAEVITMEIVGEFLGTDTDKGIWEYFASNWRHFFPRLPSRCNFSKQAANLCQAKARIWRLLVGRLARHDDVWMVDGVPIKVCHLKRSKRSRLFREEATIGYCAAKGEYYRGFKGVLLTAGGVISDYTICGASVDEREALLDCAETARDQPVIGDKGFIGRDYQAKLREEYGIAMHTALRSNMDDPRPKEFVEWLVSTRRQVETVIGQMTERFHFNRVRARNLYRFASRVARKVLAHTVGIFLLRQAGILDLRMEALVQP